MKLKRLSLAAIVLPIAVACDSSGSFTDPGTAVGYAVTGAAENIASDLASGKHLGFDTYAYPGDAAMRAWKHDNVPYEWVGYYLPAAPCHKGTSWSGKRETLMDMGWGMAVIYVGQQVWPKPRPVVKTKYVTKRVKQVTKTRSGKRVTRYVRKRVPVKVTVQPKVQQGKNCGTNLVTESRGARDADDAIARTAAEGFPRGTVIFLDIERMDVVPPKMRAYYKAWTARVLEDGRYRPGYYAHNHNAEIVYRDVSTVFVNAGIAEEPPFWLAGGKGFSAEKEPHEIGHAFANVWQGVLDIVQTHNGFKLPIDVNVASVPSPSSHEYAFRK